MIAYVDLSRSAPLAASMHIILQSYVVQNKFICNGNGHNFVSKVLVVRRTGKEGVAILILSALLACFDDKSAHRCGQRSGSGAD